MKLSRYFVFIVGLLLIGCEKVESLVPAPLSKQGVEIHIQSINAEVLVTYDGVSERLHNLDKHSVNVILLDSLKYLRIEKVAGLKVTASVKRSSKTTELGEIKEFGIWKMY